MGLRIVGIRDSDGTKVGTLSASGEAVATLASLDDFWDQPEVVLGGASNLLSIDRWVPVSEVELVPPVPAGSRVLCVGLNYIDHVAEGSFKDEDAPAYPSLFGRWAASLSVDGAVVPVPQNEDGLDWEGEVAAWVGKEMRDASPEEALEAVVGYSVFNDLTARRAQKLTTQWTLGKNADRSGPIGPMVPATEVGDLRDGLTIETRVNGEVVQSGSTAQMAFSVGDTLSLISQTLTLQPGDLLATGTPAGVGYVRTPPWLLRSGDVVEVEVERLGVLRNRIADGTIRSERATQ